MKKRILTVCVILVFVALSACIVFRGQILEAFQKYDDEYLQLSRNAYVVVYDDACSRYEKQAIMIFEEYLGSEFSFVKKSAISTDTFVSFSTTSFSAINTPSA